ASPWKRSTSSACRPGSTSEVNAASASSFARSSSPTTRYSGAGPSARWAASVSIVRGLPRTSEGFEERAHRPPRDVIGDAVESRPVLPEERGGIGGPRPRRQVVLLVELLRSVGPDQLVGLDVLELELERHAEQVPRRLVVLVEP